MFLDHTACNLASLNLMKYVNTSGQFDVTGFKHAVDVTITAQEILVDNASYPTRRFKRIRTTSGRWGWATRIWRAADVHARPYDSDEGRDTAGSDYGADVRRSVRAVRADFAERMGPFPGYERIAADD